MLVLRDQDAVGVERRWDKLRHRHQHDIQLTPPECTWFGTGLCR